MIAQRPSDKTLSTLFSALGALALLLLIHRYPGINHDASIYFGQALQKINPGIFNQDFFFAYGSQSSFTAMPWLIQALHNVLPLPTIFFAGAFLGLLLFAGASWLMLRRMLSRELALWAWIAAITIPSTYGVIRVFSYGEPFFTARPLAEAISLLALAFLIENKYLKSSACIVVAGLLHPLQAIGAILIAWPWLIFQSRRWLHLSWLALPVLLLGLIGIKPFDGIFQTIDQVWRKDLEDFTLQLFITRWYSIDVANLARDAILLLYAGWRLQGAFFRWCQACFVGLLLGVGMSLLLVDLLHLVLPTALQLWRVQWLAHWSANAAAGILLFQAVKENQPTRASILAISIILAGLGFLWTWLIPFAVYTAWPHLAPRMTSIFRHFLFAVAWLMMLCLLGYFFAEEWLPFRLAHYRFDLYAIDRRVLAFPLLSFGLALLGRWLWRRCQAIWQRRVLLFLAASLLALGLTHWDARSPVAHAIEAQSPNPALFGFTLPSQAQIYWQLPMYPAVWVALNRADYFSPWQLAGSVFNRGTPIEGRLRMERMRPIIEEDLYCQDRAVPFEERQRCRISNSALRQACAPGINNPPDFLVLPYRQAQHPLGQWSAIDPESGEVAVTFWIYACPLLMNKPATAITNPTQGHNR